MNPTILVIIKRLSVILFLSGAAILIQACNEDDPGPNEVLLTVNIDPGYFSPEFDVWIFISDKLGRPIDVRQANDSTQIKFLGTLRGSLTLTIFRRVAIISSGDGSLWNSFGLDTYQEIASGSTIDIKTGKGSSLEIPDLIATVPFTLQDYDDSDRPQDALVFSDGTSLPFSVFDYDSYEYTGNNFSTELNLRENPSKILVTTYHDDVPVYQWLNDVKPGDEVAVSFDSFVPLKTIPVNKQIAAGGVKTMSGTNFATGYIFTELYSRTFSKSSNLQNLPKLGYLEGFEKYIVSVYLNQYHERNNLSYTKAGDLPQSINLPDFTYSINNDNLYGLSVTFSNEYSYKHAFLIGSNSETYVNWSLNASDGEGFMAPSIPSEIKQLYPMLNVNVLKLEFAAYSHYLDDYTYANYVKDRLSLTQREVYEELRYVVMP